jgi:hypothetical protein
MDIEASERGTTVYLVDRRIDMLPSLLGTSMYSSHCNFFLKKNILNRSMLSPIKC